MAKKTISIKHFDNTKVKPWENGQPVKYIRIIYERRNIEFPSFYYELQNQPKEYHFEPANHSLSARKEDFEEAAFGPIEPDSRILALEIDLIEKILHLEVAKGKDIISKETRDIIAYNLCSIPFVLDSQLLTLNRVIDLSRYGFAKEMVLALGYYTFSEVIRAFSAISSDKTCKTLFFRNEIEPWIWYVDFIESSKNADPFKILRVVDWFSDPKLKLHYGISRDREKVIAQAIDSHLAMGFE